MKRSLKILMLLMLLIPGIVFAAGISVSSTSLSLEVNSTKTFNVSASQAAGQIQITSRDSSVASISFNGCDSEGNKVWLDNNSCQVIVKGVRAGSTNIVVNMVDVSDYSGNSLTGSRTVGITVKNKEVIPPPTTTTKKITTTIPTTRTTTVPVVTTTQPLSALDFSSLLVDNFTVAKEGNAYYVTVNSDTTKVNIIATVPTGMKLTGDIGERGINDGKNVLNYVILDEATNRSVEYQLIITKPTASNVDTKLSSLKVINYDLGFSPSKLEYTLNVPVDTKELYIIAEGNNKDVTITGDGIIDLTNSSGIIKITSTYGEGNTTIYTINVKKNNPMLMFWIILGITGTLLIAAIIYIILRENGKLKKGLFDSMQKKANSNRANKSADANANVKIGGSSVLGLGSQIVAPVQVQSEQVNVPVQTVSEQSINQVEKPINSIPDVKIVEDGSAINLGNEEDNNNNNGPQVIHVGRPNKTQVQTVHVGQPVKVVTKQVVSTNTNSTNNNI